MTEGQHAGVEIARVTSLVAAARRLMAEGRSVDLTALEQRVSDLCAVVKDVPEDRRATWRDSLNELLEDLDRLEGELDVRHGDPAETRAEEPARRRALAAYAPETPDRET